MKTFKQKLGARKKLGKKSLRRKHHRIVIILEAILRRSVLKSGQLKVGANVEKALLHIK